MTMYVINPVQAVGAFLPNVYISNIILRSDTGYTKNEINPHIDYPGEGTVIRGDGSLQVELALTIKDVLGAGGTSQWFSAGALPGGDSLKDYIKVNIVQAYTADSVREWSGKMVSQNIYTDQAQLITGTGISYMSLDLSEFGTGDDLSRYITEFDKNGNAIKSISKTILSSDDEWLPGSANHSTNLPAEPTDLAYFVWTSINLDNLARHFGFGPASYPQGSQQIGKVNSDAVYRNNKMVKEGYVFFEATQNGDELAKTDRLWTGPVHFNDGKYMGGAIHDPSAPRSQHPYLIRQAFPNTKIQDFRVVARLDKLELNFATFQNEILQALTKNRRVIDNDNVRFSYFTDINLSRDQNNNCRFMFGLDLRKLVRENTPYSNLFAVRQQDNPPWLREVMNKVQILSMKIYRQRVVGSSETGTTPYYFPGDNSFDPASKLSKFDSALARGQRNTGTPASPKYISFDPTDELIIDGGEISAETGKTFIGSGAASVDGVSTIRQITNIHNNNSQGIYYYTGTDANMSGNSDGYYQYRVELEIEDGVVEFLNEKRAVLLDELKKIKAYYNEGSKTSITRTGIDNNNPHIDFGGEGILSPQEQVQSANFDPTTNRFTQTFQNSAMGISWGRSALTGGVGMKYVQILQIFVELSGPEKMNIMNTLNLYVSPKAGNPQGCLAVMNLYDNLITFLNSAIGVQKERGVNLPKDTDATNAAGTSNNVFESDVASSTEPSMNTFTISHTFSDYYDANLPLNTGFDFLGADYNNLPKIPVDTGLRVIDSDTWKTSIVSKELTKLFNGINSRIDLPDFVSTGIVPDNTLRRTDFSYLTPAVVYGGQNVTLPMVGRGIAEPPNISDRDFMNMMGSWLSTLGSGMTNTNTLQEKVADFLSYNYNLTATPVPNVSERLNPPGTITTEGPSANANHDYIEASNSQTSENHKAFAVFWNLISNGVVSQGSRAGISLPEGSSQKSIGYYNPQSPDGFKTAFEWSIPTSDSLNLGGRERQIAGGSVNAQQTTSRSDGIQTQALSRTALMQQKLNNLPNVVKALIRFNYENYSLTQGKDFGGGALKAEIDNFLKSEPFESPTLSPKARILFETIGEIQYLDGYKPTKYSLNENEIEEFSSGMPIWKTLDRAAYNRIGTGTTPKALLCRIRPWESGVFKIQRHPGNDLPTYEEYFVLNAGMAPLASPHREPETYTDIIPSSPLDPPESSFPPVYTVATNWVAEEIINNVTAAPPLPPVTTAVPGATGGSFTAANAAQMQQNAVAAANAAGDNSSGAPTAPTLPGAAGSTFAPASGQQSSGQQSSGQQSATSTPNPLSGLGTGGGNSGY
tara:strand:- start:7257 stop:11222 length:3966 start_codon:yes stop_codon:yes gene_type:complete